MRVVSSQWSIIGKSVFYFALSALLFALGSSAQAQQPTRVPRIGYLAPVFPCAESVASLEAFRKGLVDLGYAEGRSITIECRSAEGDAQRLLGLATELVQLKVDVIVAAGGELVARAAQQVNQTIPVVMTNVCDPVGTGLVASLARPGGFLTGLSIMSPELSGKRLELLKETAPQVRRVAVFLNPSTPCNGVEFKEMEVAARGLRLQLQAVEVRGPRDLDKVFAAIVKERANAMLTLPDPVTNVAAKAISEFAVKNRLPAIYHRMESVETGGLMAYGPSYNDLFRRAAAFVDKILKGRTPADLPVEQPTKFEFIINLKTAKQIGLTIPPNVLARADRVIR
jgi:putative ABC transport system substrate-binding protein